MEPKLDTSVPKGPFIAIALVTLTGFIAGVALINYGWEDVPLSLFPLAYALTGALFGSLSTPRFNTRLLRKSIFIASIILFLATFLPSAADLKTLATAGASFGVSGLLMAAYHSVKDLRDA